MTEPINKHYKFGKKQENDKKYLCIPFSDKDGAKKMGAKFDNLNKMWYIKRDNKYYNFLVNMYDERLFIYDGSKYIREFKNLTEYYKNI